MPNKAGGVDWELTYSNKEEERAILSSAHSLAKKKTFHQKKAFGKNARDDWPNLLIFAENFLGLSLLLRAQQEGTVEKVKLIYIDPPFATDQEFRDRINGEVHYSDTLIGAPFFEFMRKRFILLRELLAEDGALFVHCDWHAGHYLKILLDEVFGPDNFRNEIFLKRTPKHTAMQFDRVKSLQVACDNLLVYAKSSATVFNKPYKEASERQKRGNWHGFSDNCPRPTMRYKLFGKLPPSPQGRWIWAEERAKKAVKNYSRFKKALKKGKVSSLEEFAQQHPEMDFVRNNNGSPQYWIRPRQKIMADTYWDDIQTYSRLFSYATEKSEYLLARIIKMASKKGELVLDCFAGSGTTGATAEKLGRKWIMIDNNALAIETILDRLTQDLSKKIGNKGKAIEAKPFILYTTKEKG